MASGGSGKLLVDWDLVSPIGPNLAFHAGCTIGNQFYIHGGVEKKDSKVPLNKLYVLDESMKWTEITTRGSPALSHHAAVEMGNRYMVLIGGWNGKARTSNVFVFDTEKKVWSVPSVTGFPEGGGLSSHTATLLDNGVILVLGREGSLRTQRRHGSGFQLTGSPEKNQFTYSEYTQETASRSGHTANIAASMLFIIGGRDNSIIEYKSGFKSGTADSSPHENFVEISQKLKPLDKHPSGRKHHVTISGKGALLIHGGETFDGKHREPVGDIFILTIKPNVTFFKVGVSNINRAGHVCGIIGDLIILHGGIGNGNLIYGDTHKLSFHT